MSTNQWENVFTTAKNLLLKDLKGNEEMNLSFSAEESEFIRFNHAKIRQATQVTQGELSLELQNGNKKSSLTIPFSQDEAQNKSLLLKSLETLRYELENLPEAPFVSEFPAGGESKNILTGNLPEKENFVATLQRFCLEDNKMDLAGYLTSGVCHRANANSKGQFHWFSSESFFFDYSLYTAKEKAVKGSYAGSDYKEADLLAALKDSKMALEVMDQESVVIKPGEYKVYLAPAALSEIGGLLGWHAMSGSAYKRGECPLADLYDKKSTFHPAVTIKENFKHGLSPRFNELGEVCDEEVVLVEKGEMKQLLVSADTEKEYGLKSNKASAGEAPRALEIETGELPREEILKEIGTGLYLSNLHYLNWSDKNKGRITGMTRFGCLWVEDGKVVGPIKDMRFDETLYHIFGNGLQAITNFSEVCMTTDTYYRRGIGGSVLPGLVVDGFKFTL